MSEYSELSVVLQVIELLSKNSFSNGCVMFYAPYFSNTRLN